MNSRIKILLIVLLCTGCRPYLNWYARKNGMDGYFDKDYEWVNRSKNILVTTDQFKLLEQYSEIPTFVRTIETTVEKTILASHCYTFIYNVDSTKFIAFFLVNTEDSTYKTVSRIYGAHLSYDKNENAYPEYFGYVAIGMYFQNNWYFSRHRESEFFEPNDSTARANYLFSTLNKYHYFSESDTISPDFWYSGVFGPDESQCHYYSNPFYGFPSPVSSSKHEEIGRLRYNAVRLLKMDLPILSSQNYFDSLKIIGHYNQIDILTDWHRKLLLIPIELESPSKQHYLSFIFYDFRNDSRKGFIWNNSLPRSVSTSTRNATVEHIKLFGYDWSHNIETIDSIFWTENVLGMLNEEYRYLHDFSPK